MSSEANFLMSTYPAAFNGIIVFPFEVASFANVKLPVPQDGECCHPGLLRMRHVTGHANYRYWLNAGYKILKRKAKLRINIF